MDIKELSAFRRIGQTEDGYPAPYKLAHLIGLADPDDKGSAGARFLVDAFNVWLDRVVEEHDADTLDTVDRDDIARDVASSCQPWAEVDCWRIFTDLALWRLDEIEDGVVEVTPDTLPGLARGCVEVVAYRLSLTLSDVLDGIRGKR